MKKAIQYIWETLTSWKVDIIALPLALYLFYLSIGWVEDMDPTIGSYNPYKLQKLLITQVVVMAAFLSAWLGLKFSFPPVYKYLCHEWKDYFGNGVPSWQKTALALGLLSFMVWCFIYVAVNF